MLKAEYNGLPMNLHKHLLYSLEQHSKSFEILSAIKWINTESKNP